MRASDYIVSKLLQEDDLDDEDFKDVYDGPVKRYFDMGLISNGTHDPKKLIPLFIAELRTVDPVEAQKLEAEAPEQLGLGLDEADEWLHMLMDCMFEYVPPYARLDVTEPGDADYGVWPDGELIQEGVERGIIDCISVDDEPVYDGKYECIVAMDAVGFYTHLYDVETRTQLWHWKNERV